jgi:hypothetical protein
LDGAIGILAITLDRAGVVVARSRQCRDRRTGLLPERSSGCADENTANCSTGEDCKE